MFSPFRADIMLLASGSPGWRRGLFIFSSFRAKLPYEGSPYGLNSAIIICTYIWLLHFNCNRVAAPRPWERACHASAWGWGEANNLHSATCTLQPIYFLYLHPHTITMKTKHFIAILLILSGASLNITNGQEKARTVSGIVTSFGTLPLNNVRVFADKSGKVASTDSTGRFSVEIMDRDILFISAAGFDSRKVRTGKENLYAVDLKYEDNVSNFNDAVSHRHISEALLKNALALEAKKNEKDYSKYKSIYDLITSEIYNVRINGNTIVNTKLRSFDRTPEVLLVVNDKIVPDISYIIPSDVKSIEFIDDVGSTLYGSMGANGVLKITLK